MTPDENEPLTDYSEDGVDLTLIRWMLSLTPAERLQVLQQQVDDLRAMRELNALRRTLEERKKLGHTPQQ